MRPGAQRLTRRFFTEDISDKRWLKPGVLSRLARRARSLLARRPTSPGFRIRFAIEDGLLYVHPAPNEGGPMRK